MIIGIELEHFLDEKGASPDCPKWIFPKGEHWDFYNYDAGLRLDESGLCCVGQTSQGGNINPRCERCPIRGILFPELNYHNYLNNLYKG
jgi:hypothetical protein